MADNDLAGLKSLLSEYHNNCGVAWAAAEEVVRDARQLRDRLAQAEQAAKKHAKVQAAKQKKAAAAAAAAEEAAAVAEDMKELEAAMEKAREKAMKEDRERCANVVKPFRYGRSI